MTISDCTTTCLSPLELAKRSFIDARDIAAVAVLALTQLGHTSKAYTLTGNQSLDYFEVAEILTEVLDRPIHYSRPGLLKFIWTLRNRGLPLDFVLVMAGIYTTTRLGWAATITPVVEQLLGRSRLKYRVDRGYVWEYGSDRPTLLAGDHVH